MIDMTTSHSYPGGSLPEFDPAVRGDSITPERYYSKEWMQKEWQHLWTKVWHVGGVAAELEESGDWVRHNITCSYHGWQWGNDGVLTGQEKRIQRIHELLNDTLGVSASKRA